MFAVWYTRTTEVASPTGDRKWVVECAGKADWPIGMNAVSAETANDQFERF